MIDWYAATSWVYSSDTKQVNIALYICCISSDVVSTDSDGSGGGIEHCDGSSTSTVSVGHCDGVVWLYWRRWSTP